MKLSIIIVNWNVKELIIQSIKSILKFTDNIDYEIIVADNDSKDGSIEALNNVFHKEISAKKLILIPNNFNAGFSMANNQGYKIAKGEYIAFLNPDTELLENSFAKMIELMDNNPNAGASTCRLLYGDKSTQPNVKNDPNLCSQILIFLKLHHIFKNAPCLNKYLAKGFNYSEFGVVKQIMGAFVFTKREVMEKTQGWDEAYPLWGEDLDLCKRIRDLDYDIIYSPKTELIHYESKCFAQIFGVKKQKKFNKAILIYFKKYHNKLSYYILYILQPISLLLAFITGLLKIKPKTQSKV